MAGVFLLWLTPRFFAESAYNNKDMSSLAAVMMALSVGWDFVCGDARDWRSPALFGVVCAFAVNMRVSGLIVLGLVGLLYLGTLTVNHRWSVANFLRGAEAVLASLLAFIALTPATWGGHFLDYWEYVLHNATAFSRWVDYTMAAGQLFHTELRPIPPWYIPAYIAVTVPVVLLALFLAGSVWVVAQLVRAARHGWHGWTMQQSYQVLLLLMLLLSWVSVAFGSNLYNGWRHLYSLLAPITLLATCMLHSLLTCSRQPLRWGAAAAVCGQLVFCALVIITRHPMEFAWYNVLAGPRADQGWDGDWWGIASRLVLEKTYAEIGPCSVGCEQGFYLDIGLQQCDDAVKENIAITDYREADYIAVDMQFARHTILAEQWQIPGETPDDTVAKMVQTQTPEFELKCGDFVLWGVYKNEHKPLNSN